MNQKELILHLNNHDVLEESNTQAVTWLKSTLGTLGVEIELKKNEYNDSLIIKYNTDLLIKKQTRNVGRRSKHEFEYLVSDVRALIKEKGAVQAAKELGMSKARMYARLKQADEWEDDYL